MLKIRALTKSVVDIGASRQFFRNIPRGYSSESRLPVDIERRGFTQKQALGSNRLRR
jgi:hypothetical protein